MVLADKDSTEKRRSGNGAGSIARAIPARHEFRGFPRNEMKEFKIAADHDKLMVLGQRRFTGFTGYQVVTFLNQILKERGLIFGLRQLEDDYELTIYDGHDVDAT